eukprot:gene42752-53041_t
MIYTSSDIYTGMFENNMRSGEGRLVSTSTVFSDALKAKG